MPSARPARPTSRARSTRAGPPLPDALRRRRLLRRHDRAPGPAARCSPMSQAGKIDVVVVYKVDRLTRSLLDFAKHRRDLRRGRRLLRLGHPGVQHHHLDGTADAERAALLRPVRARGHRRAHPRQDRRLQGEGHVDGRHGADRLPRRASQARAGPGRGRAGAAHLRALSRARFGGQAEDRTRPGRHPHAAAPAWRWRARAAGPRSPAASSTSCSPTRSSSAAPGTRMRCIPVSTRRSSTRSLWQAVQDKLADNRRRSDACDPRRSRPARLPGKLFDPDGEKMRPSHAQQERTAVSLLRQPRSR